MGSVGIVMGKIYTSPSRNRIPRPFNSRGGHVDLRASFVRHDLPGGRSGFGRAAPGAAFRRVALLRHALAPGGPVPRRVGHVRGGGAGRAGGLLLRRGRRGGVEDGGRGKHVVPDLRPRGIRFGRGDRRRALEPERPLRRHRADPDALRHRFGRRRLSFGRRRKELEAPRPLRDAGDRAHSRGSGQRRRRRRGGTRPHLRRQPRARHLPDGGRRQDLEPDALRGREHRRRRSRRGSDRSLGDLRRAVAGAQFSVAVVFPARRGAGQRHLQVARRRAHLEEADGRRLARDRPRTDRPRRRAGRPRVCPRRRRPGRPRGRVGRGALPVGRRRRHLAPRQRNAGYRLELHEPADGRSPQPRRRLSSPASRSGARRTAARRFASSRARPEATTITSSGSTRRTRS